MIDESSVEDGSLSGICFILLKSLGLLVTISSNCKDKRISSSVSFSSRNLISSISHSFSKVMVLSVRGVPAASRTCPSEFRICSAITSPFLSSPIFTFIIFISS